MNKEEYLKDKIREEYYQDLRIENNLKFSLNEFLRALNYVEKNYPKATLEEKDRKLKKALEIFNKEI
jgi:hypothetical protein